MTCISVRHHFESHTITTTSAFLFLLLPLAFASLNSDGLLLLSFKSSLLSDPLSLLSTWNAFDDSPCQWRGVTCSFFLGDVPDFRVTALALPGSRLLGSIPSDLGLLPRLRHLDLSNNFLNGTLPDSIFNATDLQTLSLSNNGLSGEIPSLVANLRSLQTLNLSDNALAGQIPAALTALPNLTLLCLSNNYFSSGLPGDGFQSLQFADLSSNLINGSLPPQFAGGNLRSLNLSYNRLSGGISQEFATRTPANASLDLSFNNLTGEIPETGVFLNQKPDAFVGNPDLCGKPELLQSGTCDPMCSIDEISSQDFEASYQPKTDLLKALAITGADAINHSWVAANQDIAMVLVFALGYAGIIFESLAFNKSGVGLLMAVSLWVIRSIGAPSTDIAVTELSHAASEVSEIVFYLLGAMTIVEIVDSHQGFKLVIDSITTRKRRTLLWVVGFITFFLSAILDNLTTTIAMVSLLRKLVPPSEYRKLLGAVIVIAANAGGAWSPIGAVTTTMLWIHGRISAFQTMKALFIPSAISLAVPLALMSLTSEVSGKGQESPDVLASEQMGPRGQESPDVLASEQMDPRGQESPDVLASEQMGPRGQNSPDPDVLASEHMGPRGQESPDVLASEQMGPRGQESPDVLALGPRRQLVFAVGIGALVFVPVFKAITGLPSYMGILLGLGVLWILTDAIHYGESSRQNLKVPQALSRIDTPGVLFFLGILLSVSSLEAAGILRELANYLDAHLPNIELIASAVGVVSAIIDNVPLVAATMGMYDLSSVPQDAEFWQLIALCVSTGGSMLIIGSAAGVAFMGMEKVEFFWYLRKVSGFAFAGYTTGFVSYLALQNLHFSFPSALAYVPFLSGS